MGLARRNTAAAMKIKLKSVKKHFKMLKDVGMTMLKVQEQDAVHAGKKSDDGMRNKEQHEGKGKGWPLPSCCSLFLMPSSLFFPAYTTSCSCTF